MDPIEEYSYLCYCFEQVSLPNAFRSISTTVLVALASVGRLQSEGRQVLPQAQALDHRKRTIYI